MVNQYTLREAARMLGVDARTLRRSAWQAGLVLQRSSMDRRCLAITPSQMKTLRRVRRPQPTGPIMVWVPLAWVIRMTEFEREIERRVPAMEQDIGEKQQKLGAVHRELLTQVLKQIPLVEHVPPEELIGGRPPIPPTLRPFLPAAP